MNLFLVGWSPSGGADGTKAERALGTFLGRLPFFDVERVERWHAPSGRATLVCVGHDRDRVGGARYVDVDSEGMALFSGRPFRWTGEGEADGRGPLDPAFYRRPATGWMADLDGRCAVARYDDREGELEVFTDALGAYPVYSGELDGTRWISNSAELVRTVLGSRELDLSVVACLLGSGYSLSGEPMWARVRRLPRGTLLRLRAHRPDAQIELLPLERMATLGGAGFDPARAARDLVAAVGALSDWPGRPNLLQLSGGRDSRLVFAAALAAGVRFEAVSMGTAQSPDVLVARSLCEQSGLPHRLLSPDPEGTLHERTREVARVVGLAAAGTFSLQAAAGYPIVQSTGPLPLWLNGQGGEIARAYYGRGDGSGRDELVRDLFGAVAGSAELLAPPGRERVEVEVRGAVDAELAAGVAAEDARDVFYVLNRMATWAASGFGCVEYAKGDTITPLWCARLLAHQLGPPSEERARERFHTAMLEALSPQLRRAPFAEPAPLFRPDSVGFLRVRELVREAVATQASHPAWEVIDRPYAERLLARDPASLDERGHRSLWRLGTVLMWAGPEDSR